MFPIRDHNPSGRIPLVTYGLMAANILIFFSYVGLFRNNFEIGQFFYSYGMTPERISTGDAWLTVMTSMFLHGGWGHLLGNMLFLWIFGDNVEEEMGRLRFLLFYLVAGIGAALAQVYSAPMSRIPTVGASGAIAGIMGAYLLLFPRARVDILLILIVYFRIFPIPAWIVLAVWFAMQFVGGVGADPDAGGVAYWAHAGGFAVGLVLTLPLWLRRGGPAFWARTHGQPPHPETRYRVVESRIPKVRRK